jgi:hypothetical protein
MAALNGNGSASAPVAGAMPAAGPPPAAGAPEIVPSRRRVDDRFPTLGFVIRTGGRPLFEVLLATDRSLFAPANAARRTAQTFYASRQDGGLTQAQGRESVYLVPPAVLRAFAQGSPRPAAIFYAVAAYDSPTAAPVFSPPAETLHVAAPSVELSPDFKAATLVLGVPLEKLQTVGGHAPAPGAADPDAGVELDDEDVPVPALAWQSATEPPVLDDVDGAEDDGAEIAAAAALEAAEGFADAAHALDAYDDAFALDAWEAAAAGEDEAGDEGDDEVAAEAGWSFADDEPGEEEDGAPASAAGEPLDYDDGFESGQSESWQADELGEGRWAAAQESDWPQGMSEPPPLESDEDEEGYATESAYDLGYDDGVAAMDADSGALAYEPLDAGALDRRLDDETKKRILQRLGQMFESSRGFSGIAADIEFRDLRSHPAYQRWHVGLSYGFIQFTQDSGLLGRVLRRMQARKPDVFREVFGPHADELVRVTNLPGPSSSQVPGGRSARVQPIGGADLWEEPWVSRFRRAGEVVEFQAAQIEEAAASFLDPCLRVCRWLGLDSERAIAMVVDRAIQMGVGGGRRFVVEAVSPVRTPEDANRALAALGQADLRSFQASAGLRADGRLGTLTKAALVGALRGTRQSAFTIPTREQAMDAIVAAAAGRRWAHRPRTLRTTPQFGDDVLTW